MVIHETNELTKSVKNLVDGHGVPIPHFGVVLSMDEWSLFKNRLVSFIKTPIGIIELLSNK